MAGGGTDGRKSKVEPRITRIARIREEQRTDVRGLTTNRKNLTNQETPKKEMKVARFKSDLVWRSDGESRRARDFPAAPD